MKSSQDRMESRDYAAFNDTNPFSTKFWIPGRIPYRFAEGGDCESLIEKVRRLSGMTQIVGPHGSGKTTLLECLVGRYRELGIETRRVTLNDRCRMLPNDFIPPGNATDAVFLLDGYEQLTFADRCRLRFKAWNRTGGLILTTHRPACLIPVLYRTAVRFEEFREFVFHLLKDSPISFDEKTLQDVFHRAHGNVRTAFFELYDCVSQGEAAKQIAKGVS